MAKYNYYRIFMVFAITLVTSINIYSKQLDLYKCEKLSVAENCTHGCSPLLFGGPFGRVDFEVNDKNKMVLVKYYRGGNLAHTYVLENCKIFNTKNWDCSDSMFIQKGPWTVFNINKMSDGIWTNGTYTSSSKINKETASTLGGTCAK